MGKTDLFISILRSFRGVPWVLGGRDPLVGLDCVGLLVAGLKGVEIDVVDDTHYLASNQYARLSRSLLKNCNKIGNSWKDAKPGDVLVFSIDETGNHLGVLTEEGKFIHSSGDSAYMVCLEEPLDGSWKIAIKVVYRIKGLKNG